jgi:mannose-6-phosphate isomerase class I
MIVQKKPYIIVPHLIEQPTWGGSYICEMKDWLIKEGVKGKKIGQSYELYSGTKLAVGLSSTESQEFGPQYSKTIDVSLFSEDRPFPLIKFTQAKGNSFQLHVRPTENNSHWKPKAESWYYFENGKITFGIKKGIDMDDYKNCCREIDNKMKELSSLVVEKNISYEKADKLAKEFITIKNPWQFVNTHLVKKGDVVDLSGGGLHHSWEEDLSICPQGNILYEIQQDVMDPVSTIRSFDQGKLKEDGTIREIHIDDYFKHVDQDEKRNTLSIEKKEDGQLFDTPFYSLKSLNLTKDKTLKSNSSFHHLFVKEGSVEIRDELGETICVGKGHSCFIPQGLNYTIHPKISGELLLTYLR